MPRLPERPKATPEQRKAPPGHPAGGLRYAYASTYESLPKGVERC